MAMKDITMRPLAAAAAALAALTFWVWTGTRPPLGAPPSSRGDCAVIGLWSNGFHSDLTFPTALLPAGHPLRLLDPGARYVLVGWGDEAFFRSNGENLLLGAAALLPGGATTLHVVYGDAPIETIYVPERLVPIAVSRAGMAALAARLTASLKLDRAGRAQIIAPGHGGAQSWFLKARGEFDLFNVCNQWTARTLRAAGLGINAAFLYTGASLVRAVRGAPSVCAGGAGAGAAESP
jgi:uncharacterized protein (TIGR02117 family)